MKNLYCVSTAALMLLFLLLIIGCEQSEEPKIELSASKIEVAPSGVSFTVNSNVDWTLAQSGSINYLISPKSGAAGVTEVVVGYAANLSGNESRTKVIVQGAGALDSLLLVQSPVEFKIFPNDFIEFEASSGKKTIAVESNTSWSISGITIPEWIESITASAESGNGNIDIAVKENTNRISANIYLLRVTYGGSMNKLVEIRQAAAYNNPPSKPQLIYPGESDENISVKPTFSWMPSVDIENDEITYSVMLSEDAKNWRRISAGGATSVVYPSVLGILKVNTKYYWKVVADDEHDKGTTESDIMTFTTSTRDAYADGEYALYMKSKKSNPIVLVFTGEGYIAEDYGVGGKFDTDVNDAIEGFFNIEPYKTFRDYFTVYKVAAYSNERGLTNKAANSKKDTKFGLVWTGTNTSINYTDANAIFDWCTNIPGLTEQNLTNMSIGIIINEDIYAGTCAIYSWGLSIAMMPCLRQDGYICGFEDIVRHEMAGHGFGRLADEYVNYHTKIPAANIEGLLVSQQRDSYALNISAYPDMINSPWSHFAGLADYSHVGMFEGGFYYSEGVWRSEQNSCMIDNRSYFNSASRFYIVKRILELSGEVEPINYDDPEEVRAQKMKILMDIFLSKDAQKAPDETKSLPQMPYDFEPLGAPLILSR